MTTYELQQLFKNQLAIMQALGGPCVEQTIKDTKELLEIIQDQMDLGR